MGTETLIAWCDHTFNPWEGCIKVSPGCANCYAEARDHRFTGGKHWGPNGVRRVTSESNWHQPRKWNAAAEKAGKRARVFCASLADVFEDRPELVAPRARLFALIAETPWLDWLLLTKRPANMAHLTPADWTQRWPSNVWAGTTVENQREAEKRLPWLLDVPAAVRFLSCEPLLGAVNLREFIGHGSYAGNIAGVCVDIDGQTWHRPDQKCRDCGWGYPDDPDYPRRVPDIDWVIVGGESGPRARPFDLAWARSLVEQCKAAGTAVFVKQMGAQAFVDLEPTGAFRTHPRTGQRQIELRGEALELHDKAGADPAEWPEDLRVREFPRQTP